MQPADKNFACTVYTMFPEKLAVPQARARGLRIWAGRPCTRQDPTTGEVCQAMSYTFTAHAGRGVRTQAAIRVYLGANGYGYEDTNNLFADEGWENLQDALGAAGEALVHNYGKRV